jgi:hypothetical protein
MYRKRPWAALLAALLIPGLLGSCAGSRSDITIRRDGSGTINLEYRISRLAESLGKQEGNEAWPPLPAAKADFERSVDRIAGLKIRSFSTKAEEKDVVHTIRMDFAHPQALLGFLDATVSTAVNTAVNALGDTTGGARGGARGEVRGEVRGQRVRWSGGAGGGSLSLVLGGGGQTADPDLAEFSALVFEGYEYELRFTLPETVSLGFSDGEGREREPPPGSRLSAEGNRAAFTCPMAVMAALTEPLVMELRW